MRRKKCISDRDIILKIKKFILYYKDPELTIGLFQKFIGDDNVLKVFQSSSSKSLMFITENSAYKLMNQVPIKETLDMFSEHNQLIKYNKEALPLKFNCKESFTICIKDILISPDINIIKYERLHMVKEPKNLKNILILLYEICLALKNTHDAGYYHGDVYFSNIGCRKNSNRCDFILFDFELAKEFDIEHKNEQMYRDVEMFLESLINIYEDKRKDFIKSILQYLKNKFITDTGKVKKIGRIQFKIYNYTYKKNSFLKFLDKVINEYAKNKKIEDLTLYIQNLK